jgi:hypothetical protein
LSLITNLEERLRVTSSGNVGIGHSFPQAPLVVQGAALITGYKNTIETFDDQNYGVNEGAGIGFGGRVHVLDKTVTHFSLVGGRKENDIDGDHAGFFVVETRPAKGGLTERLRITSEGNVGVGTTRPLYLFSLEKGAFSARTGANKSHSLNPLIVGYSGNPRFAASIQTYQGQGNKRHGLAFFTADEDAPEERFRIGVEGNVGVGTDTPLDLLHIRKDQNDDTVVHVQNRGKGPKSASALRLNSRGNNFFLRNYGEGTSHADRTDFYSNAAHAYFTFSPSSKERVRITSAGWVGIGTASPNGALDVVGTVRATAFVGDGSGLTNLGGWDRDGGVFYTTKNIGIGTTQPESALHVVTEKSSIKTYDYGVETVVDTTDGWSRGMRFRNKNDGKTALFGGLNGMAYIATGFDASTDPTGYHSVRVVVDHAGRMGLGINSPRTALDVVGTVNATAFVGDGSGLTGLVSWDKSGNDVFHTGRKIGVGTSAPSTALDVVGTVNATAFVGDGSQLTGLVSWDKSGSDVFHTGRKIGLGTSAPSTALDVVGTVNATAFVGDGSGLTNLGGWDRDGGVFYTTKNIGIGTTQPESALHVVTEKSSIKTYDYGVETVVDTTDGWSRGMRFRNKNDGKTALFGGLNGMAYIATGFDASTDPTGYHSVRVVVDHAGRMGLGTNSPRTALDVVGTVNATAFVGDGSGLTGLVSWDKSGDDVFHTARKIGVGTSAPSTALDVVGTVRATGLQVVGTVNATAFVGDGSGLTGLVSWDKSGSDVFHTGRKIGLGTSAPSTALDVVGTVRATGLQVAGTVNATAFVGDGSGLTGLVSWDKSGNNVFHTARKVGVGTNAPSTALDVVGTVNAMAFVGDGSQLTGLVSWEKSGSNIFHTGRRIGVGTSAPTTALDVVGTVNATAFVGDGSGLTGLGSWDKSGSDVFHTGRKVGVGTSSPSTALDVVGTVRATGLQVAGTVNATSFVGDGSGLTGLVSWDKSGNDVFHTGRKVGVGTSVPNAALDVSTGSIVLNSGTDTSSAVPGISSSRVSGEISAYASNGFGSDAGLLRLSAGGGTTVIEKSYIDLTGYNTNASDRNTIRLGTAGTERMRITREGRIGIGFDAPLAPLVVMGPYQSANYKNTISTFENANYGVNQGGGLGLGGLIRPTDTETHHFALVGGRKESPTEGDVAGAFVVETRVSNGGLTEKLRVTSTGNVGIGTTTPSTALQVVGTVNATAFIGDGSGLTNISGGWNQNASGAFYTERNVGVGTISPSMALEVVSSRNTGDGIYIQNVSTGSLANAQIRLSNDSGASGAFRVIGSQATSLGSNYGQPNEIVLHADTGSGAGDATIAFSRRASSGSFVWRAGASPGSNSTAQMILTQAGNLGIGTTNPLTKLHVAGSDGLTISAGGSTARINGTTNTLKFTFTTADGNTISPDKAQLALISNYTSSMASFRMGASHSASYPSYAFIDDTNTGITGGMSEDTLGLVTGGTERMRITSEGNVGIGTTTPATALQVIGTVNATGFVGDGSGLTNVSGGWSQNASGDFYSERNVGVGTTTPANKFAVFNSEGGKTSGFSVGSSKGLLNIWGGIVSDVVMDITNGTLNGDTGADLQIRQGGIERFRLTSEGSVGIGTASPAGMLSVYKDQDAGTRVRIDNPNSGAGAYAVLNLGNGVSGVNFMMTGIGYTSPYAINNPGGGATIYTGSAAPNGLVLGTTTGPVKFFAGSTTVERMRVDGSGNVGINVSSPTARLHVEGTVLATDSLTFPRAVRQYNSRERKPSDQSLGTFSFGFGSFNNNNVAPYADTMTFNTWGDHTGGNLNMIAFNKSAIGMRIYSGVFGSDTPFSTYKEVILADTSGNVGIGTSRPVLAIDIKSGLGFSSDLSSWPTYDDGAIIARTAGSGLGVFANAGSLIYRPRLSDVSGRSDHIFFTGSMPTERMRIASSGKVGIGTSTPATALQVIGTVNATAFVGDGSGLTNLPEGWDSVGAGTFYTGRNVGVGTSSPAASVHIAKSVDGDFAALKLMNLQGSGSIRTGVGIDFHQFNSSEPVAKIVAQQDGVSGYQGNLQFYTRGDAANTAPVERLRITSAGSVGIGTTSPSHKLAVNGDLSLLSTSNVLFVNTIKQVSSSAPLSLYSNSQTIFKNTSETEFLRITNTGFVGIGTSTPTARLDVVGAAIITGGSVINKNPSGPYYGPTIETNYPGGWAREYGFTRTGQTGKLFSFGVYGSGDNMNYGYIGGNSSSGTSHASPWMVFSPSGNVGVGTASPAAKFHVEGVAPNGVMLKINSGSPYQGLNVAGSATMGNGVVGISPVTVPGSGTAHQYTHFKNSVNGSNTGRTEHGVIVDGKVGIGTTTPTTALQVIGTVNATAFVGDGSGLTNISGGWNQSAGDVFYTDRNVGVGTTTPTQKLDVNGVIKAGNNYFNILTYHKNGTPSNGVKIVTNIPFSSGSQMITLMIEGYAYSQDTIGLILNWYIYADEFYHPHISSFGSYTPEIKLGRENGKVVIFINDKGYYHRFSIRGYAQGISESSSWFKDWSVKDEALNGDKEKAVVYRNKFAGHVVVDGKVGIGTTTPTTALQVIGTVNATAFIGDGSGLTNISGGWDKTGTTAFYTSRNIGVGTSSPTHPLHVSGNALITSRMAINAAIDPTYTLNVGGAIRATEVVVNVNGWADYVFEPDYKLMPLSDVETFVKKNRHLPGVPSEAELKTKGLNMAKVQTLQMQKIEELTLYVIELNKRNQALEARLEALEKRVAR